MDDVYRIACEAIDSLPRTEQPEDAPSLYVQFGGGLVDENGDSVDFLADTRPFSDSVEYAPVRSAKQAQDEPLRSALKKIIALCEDDPRCGADCFADIAVTAHEALGTIEA